MTLEWAELDPNSQSPGTDEPGTQRKVTLEIPSPLSFIGGGSKGEQTREKKQSQAYPGKTLSHAIGIHAIDFKQSQQWNKPIGKLPNNYPQNKTYGRDYEPPVAWNALDDILAGKVDPNKKIGVKEDNDYLRAVVHYEEGWKAAQANEVVKRYGRSYTTGFNDYVEGVKEASLGKNAHATNPGQKEGHADYLKGANHAKTSLNNLFGDAPVEMGCKAGFDDYKAGVNGHIDGLPDDTTKSAYSEGWKHCKEGRKDLSVQLQQGIALANAQQKQNESGGHLRGFYYEMGVASGRANLAVGLNGQEAPAKIAATGYTAYLAGYKAAQNAQVSPTDLGGASGHQEYLAGVRYAQDNLTQLNGNPPSGNAATTAGFNDYKSGVTRAYANPETSPPMMPQAAVLGFNDFWTGVNYCRASLDNFNGGTPQSSGGTSGFNDYKSGVNDAQAARPRQLIPAIMRGYDDYVAGKTDAQQMNVDNTRTQAGYLLGVSAINTNKQKGQDQPFHSPKKQKSFPPQ